MGDSKIELKSVSELLGMKFFIPSYQRGYRWTEQQVKDLLNDVNEFEFGKDGDFYCLQPLTVKKSGDKWCVIDGQQRLTTIYLILSELNEKTFELNYERNPYIQNLKKCDGISSENIELYCLTNARDIIKNFSKLFSIKDKLLKQTMFIFYNIGDEVDEHDYFNNLNSGRIKLTNAELIKALFLNKGGKEDIEFREVEQRILVDEFDRIERTLRQNDFWHFIAGNQAKYTSCIDILFTLIIDSSKDSDKYPDDEYRTFYCFNDWINGKGKKSSAKDAYMKSKHLWKKVKETFYILQGWFEDSVVYNLIGYHIATGKSLSDILKKFGKSKTKQDFKNYLIKECKSIIDYKNFNHLTYYENKNEVRNLLLLLNIATLNARENEGLKFSFFNYHSQKWDVEHISPQNPQNDEELMKAIKDIKDNEEINAFRQALENGDDTSKFIAKYFAQDEYLNRIENLTLLTASNNRGIKNGFFFEKRQKLQEYYQQGSFIPICSMNVFMKFYTDNPEQMKFWDENDRKSYGQAIKQILDSFFNINNEGEPNE